MFSAGEPPVKAVLHARAKLNTVVFSVGLPDIIIPARIVKIFAALKAVDRPVCARPVCVKEAVRRMAADNLGFRSQKAVKGERKIFSVVKADFICPTALTGVYGDIYLVKVVIHIRPHHRAPGFVELIDRAVFFFEPFAEALCAAGVKIIKGKTGLVIKLPADNCRVISQCLSLSFGYPCGIFKKNRA